jgi:hypothetical protein
VKGAYGGGGGVAELVRLEEGVAGLENEGRLSCLCFGVAMATAAAVTGVLCSPCKSAQQRHNLVGVLKSLVWSWFMY